MAEVFSEVACLIKASFRDHISIEQCTQKWGICIVDSKIRLRRIGRCLDFDGLLEEESADEVGNDGEQDEVDEVCVDR